MREVYVTDDGKFFTNEEEALRHEEVIKTSKKVLNDEISIAYRDLLDKVKHYITTFGEKPEYDKDNKTPTSGKCEKTSQKPEEKCADNCIKNKENDADKKTNDAVKPEKDSVTNFASLLKGVRDYIKNYLKAAKNGEDVSLDDDDDEFDVQLIFYPEGYDEDSDEEDEEESDEDEADA